MTELGEGFSRGLWNFFRSWHVGSILFVNPPHHTALVLSRKRLNPLSVAVGAFLLQNRPTRCCWWFAGNPVLRTLRLLRINMTHTKRLFVES